MSRSCNNSDVADFDCEELRCPFASGGFRHAAKGIHTTGRRKGQKAVCKWFKRGHVFENEFYTDDIKAMEKAVDLVRLWNNENIISQRIRVNVPEAWTFDAGEVFVKDTKVLVEPFIENYKKFNSNSGWNSSSTPWHEVMQALSHFSYHISGGRYLLWR